jgi:hypothetical protein
LRQGYDEHAMAPTNNLVSFLQPIVVETIQLHPNAFCLYSLAQGAHEFLLPLRHILLLRSSEPNDQSSVHAIHLFCRNNKPALLIL